MCIFHKEKGSSERPQEKESEDPPSLLPEGPPEHQPSSPQAGTLLLHLWQPHLEPLTPGGPPTPAQRAYPKHVRVQGSALPAPRDLPCDHLSDTGWNNVYPQS